MIQESELLEVVALIQEEHPAAEFSDRKLAIWLANFREADISGAEAAAATVRCLGRRPFVPKIAELVEMAIGPEGWADRFRRLRGLHIDAALGPLNLRELAELDRLARLTYGRIPPAPPRLPPAPPPPR